MKIYVGFEKKDNILMKFTNKTHNVCKSLLKKTMCLYIFQ